MKKGKIIMEKEKLLNIIKQIKEKQWNGDRVCKYKLCLQEPDHPEEYCKYHGTLMKCRVELKHTTIEIEYVSEMIFDCGEKIELTQEDDDHTIQATIDYHDLHPKKCLERKTERGQ